MRRRNNPSKRPSAYRQLEPRQMLATTLYVDFGWATGDSLTITDAESASLNGPEVFGDGYQLNAFSSYPQNEAPRDVADDVLDQLKEIFEPFDVRVQEAVSANVAEMGEKLAETDTNDAYVFVGGFPPANLYEPAHGASVGDPGNTEDNLAFVFMGRIYRDYRNHVSRAIAQEAARTWGLGRVEASNAAAADDVMALPGTDENGEFYDDLRSLSDARTSIFQDVEMDAIRISGTAVGDPQNSFQALGAAVGFADSTTWFTTTSADDSFEVTFTGPNAADVIANGVLHEAIDVSEGIKFIGPGSKDDSISFDGEAFELSLTDDDGIFSNGITYSGFLNVETGSDSDTVTIEGNLFENLSTGDGDDNVTWNVDPAGRDSFQDFFRGNIRTGAGDDTLTFLDNTLFFNSFDGGVGYDRIDYSAVDRLWETLRQSDENGILASRVEFNVGGSEASNFEHVVGPVSGEGTLTYLVGGSEFHTAPSQIDSRPMTAEVDGDFTTLYDREHNIEVVYENFGNIDLSVFVPDSFDPLTPRTEVLSEVLVLSTNRDMSLWGDKVQLSSDADVELGSTDGFVGDLEVQAQILFVVGNKAGEAKDTRMSRIYRDNGSVSHATIDGMTDGTIKYRSRSTVIHGSDGGNDRFLIDATFALKADPSVEDPFDGRELYVQGHGGDDVFNLGSTLAGNSGDLNKLDHLVHVFAGEGRDYLYLNDAGGDGNYSYLLNENWVTNSPDPRGDVIRDFRGVFHRDFEAVRLTGTNQDNIYRVTPSEKLHYNIDGAAGSDKLLLVGEVPENRFFVKREGQGTGTWWFGNEPGDKKLVLFEHMDSIAGVDRVAVSTQAGDGRSVVRVIDPRTQRTLFDLKPYGANYGGGVQVSTGDLNGDAVPDIVIAPGLGRYALVMAFDGLNGRLLTSFNAFPAPYNTGADVAVGNVQGDDRNEIVVSTLRDGMQVSVFAAEEETPLEFRSVNEFTPYPSAPGVGLRVTTADMNWDGVEDIITVPGPGWMPQVAVHDVSDNSATQVSRFLAYVPGYLGGMSITTGHFDGNRRPEIIVGAGITQNTNNPLSGQFRVFKGETLPRNAGDDVLRPLYTVEAFSGTERVSVTTLDSDLDGRVDRILAAPTNGTSVENRVLKSFDTNGKPSFNDVLLSDSDLMKSGVDVG